MHVLGVPEQSIIKKVKPHKLVATIMTAEVPSEISSFPQGEKGVENTEKRGLFIGEGYVDLAMRGRNRQLHEEMLALRQKFVVEQGWRKPGERDWDMYDDSADTLHFGLRDQNGERLAVGLRLTNISSVEQSLSWSMLTPDMVAMAYSQTDENGENVISHLNETGREGNLWDLTRLVNVSPQNPENPDPEEIKHIIGAMMEVFGAAAATIRSLTPPDKRKDIRWLYATSAPMRHILRKRLGVQMSVLAKGQISTEDAYDTYLCVVDQEAGIKYIQDRPDEFTEFSSLQHLNNGLGRGDLSGL